ncbi:polyisoprenoid-binding protein YceI [Blastomonas natatoria]|uniref:Polyisoprenoid-binding protein YceI n=1 Tax=Blastomonas natatoria TaxID=34015 RepID=A0A2V3UYM9_9SPHN|nr:YceI family protein [Blastomonas natatoria]PXW74407.1 polyisoprenoid-binding protein YceI [Blastomonas natatoria]
MRKTLAILAFAAAAAATPLIGQGVQLPGQKDASRVTAGVYKADPGHSLIGWEVNHFGFNDYYGLFGDVAGTLTIDPANLNAAKVDVTIPVGKVTTASAGLTSHLLRAGKDGGKPDFFGPNPADARFVSTKVVASGTTAKITGDLTLNGITKPVTFDAEFTGAGANPFNKKLTVGFEAETSIKRSDFGINYALPMVSDEVELDISVAFEKQ